VQSGRGAIESAIMTTWRTSRATRVAVRDQLDRLAWHFGQSITQLIEEGPAQERNVMARLTSAREILATANIRLGAGLPCPRTMAGVVAIRP
jgi:hypothetical protein